MKILDKALVETKLDRKSTLVALGGGVIGDMVGFAAAIYQHGVCIQSRFPLLHGHGGLCSGGGEDCSQSPAGQEYDWGLLSTHVRLC